MRSTNRQRNTNVLPISRYCGFFKMLAAPIYWCNTKSIKKLAAPRLFRLNKAYSSAGVELKTETNGVKMAAKFREKRTWITTMGAKTQAFAIFLCPPYFSLPTACKSTHFIFSKCPIYTHAGASVKFSTNSHEKDYSVFNIKRNLSTFSNCIFRIDLNILHLLCISSVQFCMCPQTYSVNFIPKQGSSVVAEQSSSYVRSLLELEVGH